MYVDPWNKIGNKSYLVNEEKKSHDGAVESCIQIGTKLFEPETAEESNDVHTTIVENMDIDGIWLGLRTKCQDHYMCVGNIYKQI